MRLAEKTDKAVKVTETKSPPVEGQVMFFHWIPRSLIGYSRTVPSPVPGEFPIFTFSLPEWKIDQTNLWKFVQ